MFELGKPEDSFQDLAKELIDFFPNSKKVVKKTRRFISASHSQIQGKMWNGDAYIKTDMLNITHIIDRVGTGDAFAAGLIYGILHYDDEQALDFASAVCALKHTFPDVFGKYDKFNGRGHFQNNKKVVFE